MGEKVKTDVRVMKSEARQLNADSKCNTWQRFLFNLHSRGLV